MPQETKRVYRSDTRKQQAEGTRAKIADAAYQLLLEKRYDGMTIEAIAQRAGVAVPTVYAAFRSKAGILAELLDRAAFDSHYQELVRQASAADDPAERLRFAARISRHVYDARSETMDLLQGASLVRAELGDQMRELEDRRYEGQKHQIEFLQQKGRLRANLDTAKARDILWSLTSREMYSVLVRQRKWSSQEYEDWLGETLIASLLKER